MKAGFPKIFYLLFIVGLTGIGLLVIGQTRAYFSDSETSAGNIQSAGSLDFSISAPGGGFSPTVAPDRSSERAVSMNNDGSLGFQYKVSADNFSGGLCASLDLTAKLDGVQKYAGPLAGFNAGIGGPFLFGAPEDWDFSATLAGGAAPADWYDADWEYRKKITIDSSRVAADLTDFPVLISITDPDLRDNAQADGDDIFFAQNGLRLAHELEKYDSATGELIAWVKVENLSGSADTEITMYYGNPTAGSQENPADVWSNGYDAVWHFYESFSDSTFNSNDAANFGTTDTAGKIGKGRSGDGANDYIDTGIKPLFDKDTSLSFWIKYDGGTSQADGGVHHERTGDIYFQGIPPSDNQTWQLRDAEDDRITPTIGSLTSSTAWHYIAVVYDESEKKLSLYLNGSLVDSDSNLDFSGLSAGMTDLNLLGHPGAFSGDPAEFLEADIDEHRIQIGNALSPDWIATEYNNQSSPGTFYNLGVQETMGGSSASSLQGETCLFDFVFSGWQEGFAEGSGGFTDTESIASTIEAGYWDIALNEFLPNPDGFAYGFDFGEDADPMPQGEWVEIYNKGTIAVDLAGWEIRDAGPANAITIAASNTDTGSTVIGPAGSGTEWLVVYMSGAVLNNDGDTVSLYDASDNLIDSYSYDIKDFCELEPTPGDVNDKDPAAGADECPDGVPGNKSWARIPDGTGAWVDPIPTPGAPNIPEDQALGGFSEPQGSSEEGSSQGASQPNTNPQSLSEQDFSGIELLPGLENASSSPMVNSSSTSEVINATSTPETTGSGSAPEGDESSGGREQNEQIEVDSQDVAGASDEEMKEEEPDSSPEIEASEDDEDKDAGNENGNDDSGAVLSGGQSESLSPESGSGDEDLPAEEAEQNPDEPSDLQNETDSSFTAGEDSDIIGNGENAPSGDPEDTENSINSNEGESGAGQEEIAEDAGSQEPDNQEIQNEEQSIEPEENNPDETLQPEISQQENQENNDEASNNSAPEQVEN